MSSDCKGAGRLPSSIPPDGHPRYARGPGRRHNDDSQGVYNRRAEGKLILAAHLGPFLSTSHAFSQLSKRVSEKLKIQNPICSLATQAKPFMGPGDKRLG